MRITQQGVQIERADYLRIIGELFVEAKIQSTINKAEREARINAEHENDRLKHLITQTEKALEAQEI